MFSVTLASTKHQKCAKLHINDHPFIKVIEAPCSLLQGIFDPQGS
jgi:hypothetical protein